MNQKQKFVAITGEMLGIMDKKQFEAMMARFATAENISVTCSDGECFLPEGKVEKLKSARKTVPLTDEDCMRNIVMRVREEGQLLFTAATGRSHQVDTTEERLRNAF